MANGNEQANVKGWNINSAGITVIIGISAWALIAILGLNSKTDRIETSLPYIQQSVNDLKTQIGNLVTKPELEATKKEIQNDNLRFQNEILKAQHEKRISPSGY